jgi:hypothetical protein
VFDYPKRLYTIRRNRDSAELALEMVKADL